LQERVHVAEKLGTTLLRVFNDTYSTMVLHPHNEPPEINRRLQITLQHFRPPISDPATMMNLVKGLYALSKG
jgi:hypothetical protein